MAGRSGQAAQLGGVWGRFTNGNRSIRDATGPNENRSLLDATVQLMKSQHLTRVRRIHRRCT